MLLSALTIHPYAIATVIGLAYLWRIGGRWSWPCLLDAALLALYVWRPGWPLLALILAIGAVRHTPALAREVAILFSLDTFDGWTLRMALFALPALRVYTTGQREDKRELPPMVGPTTALPAAPSEVTPLSFSAAQAALNDDPSAPHLGVIGATRLGKTTFVGVLLAYRYSELVIATPKAAQYDPWFDADVARPIVQDNDMSYAPIEQAINSVYREMLRRNTPGASAKPVITLVLDEWTQIAELPGVAKKVINLLRMGAGCGIRLILMATDVNVRGWKMDGVAGVLDNLIFAKVEGARQWSIGRLDANWRVVEPRRVDTAPVLGLAQRVSLAGRAWAGARVSVPVAGAGADPLLGGLLAGVGVGVPPVGVGPSVGAGGGVHPPASVSNGRTDGRTALVAYLKAHPTATREQTRASGLQFENEDYGLIKKAIERGLL